MSIVWTLLRATAVLGGLMAALLTGGIAHADPAPSVPAPNIGDQLVSTAANTAANAPQLLQNLATALGATPPAPTAPPPLAGASVTVPQPAPAAVAGAPAAVPATTAGIPGINSAVPGASAAVPRVPSAVPGTTAGAPATAPGLMPQAQLNLPQVPFLGVPLPQQVSLPGDLASLAPGGLPIPRGVAPTGPAIAAPVPAAVPVAPSNPLTIPLSALP